jgi:hypothetical protein
VERKEEKKRSLIDRIEHGKTWKPLKGIVLDVVKTVVFPLLCFSDADQELWDSDPYEYVRTKFGTLIFSLLVCDDSRSHRLFTTDLYEDFRSPVPAAMALIQQLASQRKPFALIPMLSFCNDILLK